MVDYAKLIEQAKAVENAANQTQLQQKKPDVDPKLFFQRVTAKIHEEMDKANEELRKRGFETITRNYLPTFDGVVFLVTGSARLCRVELEIQGQVPRIKAVISGPPNGNELSRREFLVGEETAGSQVPSTPGGRPPIVGASSEEIAQEIITGAVLGTFD